MRPFLALRPLVSPFALAAAAVTLVVACSSSPDEPHEADSFPDDASAPDTSAPDAAIASDAAPSDATVPDATQPDAARDDGGLPDAAPDATHESDASTDDASDASVDAPITEVSDASVDAPIADAADASIEDASDAQAAPDAALPSQLLLAGNLVPLAVTSDGWVVYEDLANSSIGVVSTSADAGSAGATVISAAGSVQGTPVVSVSGTVAFVQPNTNDDPGPIVVWSSATGTHTIPNAVAAGDGFMPVASADGAHVLYLTTGGDGGSASYQLVEASTDLSSPIVVAANLYYAYAPVLTAGRFVLFTSSELADGGATLSLDSYDSTGARAHLYDGFNSGYTASPTGGQVFITTGDTNGDVVEVSAAGGAATQVAANVKAGFTLTPDGSRAVYISTVDVSGQLLSSYWTTPTASPNPVELSNVAAGLYYNSATFTPDGAHFTFIPGSQNSSFDELWTASTVAGDEIVFSVVPGIDETYVTSQMFSADSSYLATLIGFDDASTEWGLGVAPVNGPTVVPVPGANGVTTNVTPATGSRFVYTTGSRLWVVDAAQPSAPVNLAALSIAGTFVLTPAGTSVVYPGTGAAGAGLYLVPLP